MGESLRFAHFPCVPKVGSTSMLLPLILVTIYNIHNIAEFSVMTIKCTYPVVNVIKIDYIL
jgi:hypothetical protein